MADDFVDPFANIDLNAEPEGARPDLLPRTTPLTLEERLIVQNLFDTQPKRRQAYMKKLGLELDPSDTNKYRPLGSTEPFTAEIDPGTSILSTPGGLGKKFKAIAEETGKDMLDILGDVISAATTTKSAAAGATVGGAAAGPAFPVGIVMGGILGGAAGSGAVETTKEELGNMLLDESVPADKGLMAVQATLEGLAPAAMKLGAKGLRSAYAGLLSIRTTAIKNAARAAGSGITEDLLVKASQQPEMFTKEAVEGANKRIGLEYKKIFGIDESDALTPRVAKKITPDSEFGKYLQPLNKQADEEISKLSRMPEANWKASEILGPINKAIDDLSFKFSRTAEEEAALKYLKGKKAFVENKAKAALAPKLKMQDDMANEAAEKAFSKSQSITPGGSAASKPVKKVTQVSEDMIMNSEFDFKQGREFLKTLQDDSFNRELPGAPILSRYAGFIRSLADQKAGSVGSKLPEINAQRSQVLEVFDEARANITPSKLTAAFIGGDNIAKDQTKLVLSKMDNIFGTNISQSVENGAMQRILENAYKSTVDKGSSRAWGSMMTEGVAGAAKGGTLGFAAGAPLGAAKVTTPIGAVVGGIQGMKRGALMAQPEVAIPALAEAATRQQAAEALALRPLQQQATPVTQGLGAMAAKSLATPSMVEEDEDPFKDINFE